MLAEQHRWLRDIATLKTILLLVGTSITAATPVFPKRSTDTELTHALLLQQQIAELQSAASRNAENTKELAAQLQGTVSACILGAVAWNQVV